MELTLNLDEFFEWSAEARILTFLIEKSQTVKEECNWWFASEISLEGRINTRTIRSKMPRLEAYGFVEKEKRTAKYCRMHNAYRLRKNDLTDSLIVFTNTLKKLDENELPELRV